MLLNLKTPPLSMLNSLQTLFFALLLALSISILHSSFADSITVPSPLVQLKNGEFANSVQCTTGMVLVKKSFISVACVKPQTAESLVKRGWGTIISSYKPDITPKGNMLPVTVQTNGAPI